MNFVDQEPHSNHFEWDGTLNILNPNSPRKSGRTKHDRRSRRGSGSLLLRAWSGGPKIFTDLFADGW